MKALVSLLILAATFLRAAEPTNSPAPLSVGCQAFTFNRFTVYEAIEKTAEAGGTVIEFISGQRLIKAEPGKLSPDMSDEQLAALHAHLKKHGVAPASLFIGIPNDEAGARKVFEFGKRLGVKSFSMGLVPDQLDLLEKMVKEFDIRVGFHNHGKTPLNRSWDPAFVLEVVKNRDARLGLCADTGHWATSGLNGLDAIKLVEDRIINLHLKDRAVVGQASTDLILGTGVTDIAGIVAELRRQKFAGSIFVEYETNWLNSVPDVKRCIEFIHHPVAKAASASPTSPAVVPQAPEFHLDEPGLKAVVIDSDERESFLGLQLDSAGRLFAGCREALFVYEPAAGGLYAPRQLLFRFPKDAWVYDIAIRGDDLYVSTHTAIYLLPGAVKKRAGIEARRLVWGLPMMKGFDMHQGIHGLVIGPEGDLYFANGDEIIGYGDKDRMDHWSHWTYHHGTKGSAMTGCGGVFRFSPDGEKFSVVAAGTRNSCGIAFDHEWNLFTSDNDHEGRPADYVPGRVLHVTPGAYFSWPRGWMPEKTPWRADLLDSLHPDVGRYVPTGMAYYDESFLPAACRHGLYIAEWGRAKLLRYPLKPRGASFQAEQVDFFSEAETTARPVGVAVGRGGRLFTSVCHMKGNEASPMYRSEIVMITRAEDAANAPFEAYEETAASADKLFAELASDSWHRRYRAHIELMRRGASVADEAAQRFAKTPEAVASTTHLSWLIAASGKLDLIAPLVSSAQPMARLQALRALAKFAPSPDRATFEKALDDANPQVVHAALVALRERFTELHAKARVITLAQSADRLLRQSAVQLLARRLPLPAIQKLCESSTPAERLAGVLIAGERLTVPPVSGALPESWPQSPMLSKVAYVDETVELHTGNFTMADVWAAAAKSPEEQSLFALLERRLDDPVPDHAKQAAFFLRLLKDPRTDARATAILGIKDAKLAQATPIQGATSTGITELPTAFAKVDWTKEVPRGDAARGAKLFTERGCAICHAAKAGDNGGGGPSLIGAGTRFTVPYLVESVITPNKTVSPIFKWTMVTKTDGSAIAGLITSETAAELELLLPAGIRQNIRIKDIAKRELQDRSPMPEGLIQTPDDLRDLLSYLLSLKEVK
jgi:putative heme-binding domain-containing protein